MNGPGRLSRSSVGVETGGVARPALRVGEFVPLAALLMSLVALSIDTMLPALPAIGADLGVARRNEVQLVVTACSWGLPPLNSSAAPSRTASGGGPSSRAASPCPWPDA